MNSIQKLSDTIGREWSAIEKARSESELVREIIADQLRSSLGRLDSDVDIVVFGSLAREEWTSGSDVDWTLLIDGQATADHQDLAQEVRKSLQGLKHNGNELPGPGATGIFGSLTFSHDLIHLIGGDIDSNHNMTKRILLLLESQPIRLSDENGVRAYERTTSGIVDRYLRDDANVLKANSTVPRFLLNDIVRYWRTLCVDFAWKEWEKAGEKWALRNIKLRMSRKLLFVSALLRVFVCESVSEDMGTVGVFSQLMRDLHHPPLHVVTAVLTECGLPEDAGRLLDHYDSFLAAIDDPEERAHLKQLSPRVAYEDDVFLRLREVSHEFQNVISDVFFDKESPVAEFTRTYGVF